jgi:exopolysaccharide production protein ExoY
MDATARPYGFQRSRGRDRKYKSQDVDLFDRTVALCALVFLAPLLILTAILVFITDPGPIFFGHSRIGYGGKSFKCLKFRTMVVDADRMLAEHLRNNAGARLEWARDHKLRDDPRVTFLGKYLRIFSIDELPQLLNVVLGDMRLVGPRPIVSSEIEKYGRFFSHYTSVPPGLTGLWQISGRNEVSYRRRVAADVFYVRNRTRLLNLKIMFATIETVVTTRGAS